MIRKEIERKILGSAILSIAFEANVYPKPLAVDRYSEIKGLRFENFLATASYLSIPFFYSIKDAFKNDLKLGKRIYEATLSMLASQSGGNTSLGSIMLLIPLITASAKVLSKSEKIEIEEIRNAVREILNSSSYKDSIYLCKAILITRPKWLLKVSKFDITKESWESEIRKEEANLKEIMKEAEEYDWIAFEYANDFEITCKENYPYFKKSYEDYGNANHAALKTYLWILSKRFDSHIYREYGKEKAEEIKKKAENYLKKLQIEGNIEKIAYEFKREYENSNIVAGTSADLIVSTLFLSFLTFLKI